MHHLVDKHRGDGDCFTLKQGRISRFNGLMRGQMISKAQDDTIIICRILIDNFAEDAGSIADAIPEDPDEAMAWLETLPGVARKNSAGVMNASTFERRAMVIDGHHRRIMQRMGIVTAKADTARTYDTLMPIVPEEWSAADMDEHHLLLKKLGQTHCRPRAPDCANCFARDNCQTGRSSRGT